MQEKGLWCQLSQPAHFEVELWELDGNKKEKKKKSGRGRKKGRKEGRKERERRKETEKKEERKKERKGIYWLVYLETDTDVNSRLAKDACLL